MTPPFRHQEAPNPEHVDAMDGQNNLNAVEHHHPHGDYDWMGILDSLETGHHHGGYSFDDLNALHGAERGEQHDLDALTVSAESQAEDVKIAASEKCGKTGQSGGSKSESSDNHGPEKGAIKSQEQGVASSRAADARPKSTTGCAVASFAVKSHFPSYPAGEDDQRASSSASSSQAVAVASKPMDGNPNEENDDEEAKKSSRVERKRCREKQRRLDTNSQFAALADIVREIETRDFAEEAAGLGWNAPASSDAGVAAAATSAACQSTSNSVEEADSSKKFKTDYSSNASSKSGSSNRVDLIARTCTVITQLRQIRRNRREELRDAKRQNFEMRKEIEELRRVVAHHKALGMGPTKPQEKIMMMVPMMVPQDAVSSLSAGYPSAHPMGCNSASPWMTMAAQTNNMTAMHPQFAAGMHAGQSASAASHQPAAQFAAAPGVASFPGFQNSMQFMNVPQGQNSIAPTPHHGMHQLSSFGQPVVMQQHQQTNFQQANAQNGGVSISPGANHAPIMQTMQGQVPSHAQSPLDANPGNMHQQTTFTQAPISAHQPNYPHMTSGAPPNVPFNMHSHMQNQQSAPPAPSSNSNDHSIDTTAKPPQSGTSSPHQGGGGNLAHCA